MAAATPISGNEFQINTYTTNSQGGASVTGLPDGGFVVTWESLNQDGDSFGVYGQVYDADGTARGTEFQVNTVSTLLQIAPAVTGLSDGSFVITWTSSGQTWDPINLTGGDFGIYAQRFDANGTPQGGEFQVNSYQPSDQSFPAVAGLSDGGFVVTWASYDQDGDAAGIYGQAYAANGTAQGSEFRVNTYTTDAQDMPSVAALSDGGFVVTWSSTGQDGDFAGIYGQIYNADGTVQGSELHVSTYTANAQDQSSVTGLTDGGFVVTWMSEFQDGTFGSIYGQVYNADGTARGTEFQINSSPTTDQFYPSVTGLSDGGFMVTWESNNQDGSFSSIYGQAYDADGTARGGEFRVNTYATDAQSQAAVAGLSGGGAVVVWDSYGQDGDSFGVFGQLLRWNAPLVGTPAITGTAAEDQTLTADTSGLTDADGVASTAYQWLRDGTAISGATNATYTLTQEDVGAAISVRVSVTDNIGTTESATSAATAAVANVNDDPTGTVSISGTATEDATLTASNTLADEDGMGSISYQWLRGGTAISGATGETYTLTQADVGAAISVRASYTDGYGAAESRTSAATALVANVNDDPTGTVSISGTATEDQTLTASNTLADEDGMGSITYQWLRDGNNISGATGETYTLTQADVGAAISVRASYTDGYGATESETSAATDAVVNVNDDPTGEVIITGTAAQGETLDASHTLADEDGLGDPSYQWLRNGAVISGATGESYTLTADDVGAEISVRASYTDGQGTDESVTSAGSLDVIAAPSQELEGSDSGDTLVGSSGNDTLNGGDGNDILIGGSGNNNLLGGNGNDTAFSGSGLDLLAGGSGFDFVHGGGGVDTVHGGSGNDTVAGGSGNDLVFGGIGRDTVAGGNGNDFVSGGFGNDRILGGSGGDTVIGGQGNDLLAGNDGADTLDGGSGDDLIYGGVGYDTIDGGAGDDTLFGGDASDLLLGGAGDDVLSGGEGVDSLTGGDGADRFEHLDHTNYGIDWILDYDAAEGDVLEFEVSNVTVDLFHVSFRATEGRGEAGTNEAFVTFIPTEEILWALVDGEAQDSINLQIGSHVYDLLA